MEAPLEPRVHTASRVFLLLALAAPGCGDHSVVRPSSGPAIEPPALNAGTISGTVFDHSTGTRRAAAGIRVRLQRPGLIGPTVETTSDATGQYQFVGVSAGAVTVAPPLDSAYRAPCPFGTDANDGAGMRIDVHVVSTSILTTTGSPGSLPTYIFAVRGTVSSPSHVVGGASVEVANFGPEALSATLSGPDGRFVLCVPPPGVGSDQDIEVRVSKDGYRPLTHVVNLGWAGAVNLQLELVPE